jgi:hypothetical protein
MLLVGSLLMGAADPASTCIFIPPLLHRVDAALKRVDAEAPLTPTLVSVDTFRRNGMTCTRASCVQNSCGDTGTIRIELAPSADDVTPAAELGYRLLVMRGELPASLQDAMGVTLAAGRPVYLRPSFDELPALDLELAAVAVDAAGNESAPTEPFEIRFDGCTLAAVGDRCEDELDADTDLSRVLDEQLGGSAEPAAPVAAGASCALGGPAPNPGFGGALSGALLSALLVHRRRSRARS